MNGNYVIIISVIFVTRTPQTSTLFTYSAVHDCMAIDTQRLFINY